MQAILFNWLWQGKQKILFISFLVSIALWIGAYIALHVMSDTCLLNDDSCFNLWSDTLGAPFYWGFLLKSMIIAPLLLLPFSMRVFKVWAIMSVIFLPIALYRVIVVAPITAQYFDKMAESNIMGEVYLVLTIAIIVVVSVGEFVLRKKKR